MYDQNEKEPKIKNTIQTDEIKEYFIQKEFKPSTQKTINILLKKFLEFTQQTIPELINQTPEILNNQLKQYENHLNKKNHKPQSITVNIRTIILFYQFHNPNTKIRKTKTDLILDDLKIKNFLFAKQSITDRTKRNYIYIIKDFCNIVKKTPTEIIDELILEQQSRIENGMIINFNPSNSMINTYINMWIADMQQRGLTEGTIENKKLYLTAFLRFYNLKLPKTIELKKEKPKLNILSWDMIKKAIDDGTPTEKAIYSFMASTSIRAVDVRHFKIKDFMNATSSYHDYEELDDFIKFAPENMIGYWEFTPIKTQRYNIECKTFNSPESSNYLIEYLKFRQRKLKQQNKINGTNRIMSKNDYLFEPYKKGKPGIKYSTPGFYKIFVRRNEILYEYEYNKLLARLDKGEISKDTFDEYVDCIPKFSQHQLRRYAISTFANNNVNLRVAALFEGHKPPLFNDYSYVKLDKDTLEKAYLSCLEDLSFENTRVNVVTTDKEKRLLEQEAEIKELKRQFELINQKINKENLFNDLSEIDLEKEFGDKLIS